MSENKELLEEVKEVDLKIIKTSLMIKIEKELIYLKYNIDKYLSRLKEEYKDSIQNHDKEDINSFIENIELSVSGLLESDIEDIQKILEKYKGLSCIEN